VIQLQQYIGAGTLVMVVAMVIARLVMLRRRGIRAMKFGETHKTDFLIPPVALFYAYSVLATAFSWPKIADHAFFQSENVRWAGVALCIAALAVLLWSLISFGKSFRVGIDEDHPGGLVTTGVFALSRNPIYVAFALVLVGEFLVYSSWIRLLYLMGGILLLHRQVMREEGYLSAQYGEEYAEYRARVRRYM
jgi:protein-S-isoprenylcysteine O-methyltransferase Ste14